jgi:hypothetical protein
MKATFFGQPRVVNCKGIMPFEDETVFPLSNSLTQLTTDFPKGVMMNSWPDELMAECHRQRIREEVKQIYLERSALKARRRYRPRLFERAMFIVGNWMILIGTRLCKRYEIPGLNSGIFSLSK